MATSYRLNKQKSKLFKETPTGRWHFPFALLLSFSIMLTDKIYPVGIIHEVFATIAYPFHALVNTPAHMLSAGSVVWKSKQSIIDENQNLTDEVVRLRAKLQQFLMVQDENRGLRELLTLSKELQYQTKAAEILSFESSGVKQTIIINKGQKDGITRGQLVIDTEGVAGQVIEVSLLSSKVLLISDAASAVPVRNQRTGEIAILIGTNDLNHLSLMHLPKTSSVNTGDILVTSGLGSRYPAGYPVGVVEAVKMPPGEAFIQVDVQPFTHYYRNRFVLLISEHATQDNEGKKS